MMLLWFSPPLSLQFHRWTGGGGGGPGGGGGIEAYELQTKVL